MNSRPFELIARWLCKYKLAEFTGFRHQAPLMLLHGFVVLPVSLPRHKREEHRVRELIGDVLEASLVGRVKAFSREQICIQTSPLAVNLLGGCGIRQLAYGMLVTDFKKV